MAQKKAQHPKYEEYTTQGYGAEELKADLAAIKANWGANCSDPATRKQKDLASHTPEKLNTGKDAALLKPSFDAVLQEVVDVLRPQSDLKYSPGPLKKMGRMYEKGISYGIEENLPDLDVARIRDILRGTITFQTVDRLRAACKTDLHVIDLIEKAFVKRSKGNDPFVLQVKNRFIHGKKANIAPKRGLNLDDVEKYFHIGANFESWAVQDAAYRDIQALVVIPSGWDGKQLRLKHHIAEVQITVLPMTDAKHGGGHKYYRKVRNVLEFLEYEMFKKKHGGALKLAQASDFYAAHAPVQMRNEFPDAFTEMAVHYRQVDDHKIVTDKEGPVQNCIDNSKWYKEILKSKGVV